jgi:hypothetical protein
MIWCQGSLDLLTYLVAGKVDEELDSLKWGILKRSLRQTVWCVRRGKYVTSQSYNIGGLSSILSYRLSFQNQATPMVAEFSH